MPYLERKVYEVPTSLHRVTSVKGGSADLRGAAAIANGFLGRFRGVQPAIVEGEAGAAWATMVDHIAKTLA